MTLTFEQTGENEWEMYTPQCAVPEQGERGGPEALAYAVDVKNGLVRYDARWATVLHTYRLPVIADKTTITTVPAGLQLTGKERNLKLL